MDFVNLQFPPVMDAEEETDNVEPHSSEESFELFDSDGASQ